MMPFRFEPPVSNRRPHLVLDDEIRIDREQLDTVSRYREKVESPKLNFDPYRESR